MTAPDVSICLHAVVSLTLAEQTLNGDGDEGQITVLPSVDALAYFVLARAEWVCLTFACYVSPSNQAGRQMQ